MCIDDRGVQGIALAYVTVDQSDTGSLVTVAPRQSYGRRDVFVEAVVVPLRPPTLPLRS